MFIFERERERAQVGEAERERERTGTEDLKRADSSEPDAGLELTSCEIMT